MAYAFVQQSASSTAAAGTTISATLTPTVGNKLIVNVVGGNQPNTITASDGTANSYNQIVINNTSAGHGCQATFYCDVAVGGSLTVTATITGSYTGNLGIVIEEFSGLATGAPVASSVVNATGNAIGPNVLGSGTVATGTSVPALLYAFAYDFNGYNASVPPTAGTSPVAFTGRAGVFANLSSAGTVPIGVAEDARITAGGSYTATYGCASSNEYDAFGVVVAIFAEASGGVPYMPYAFQPTVAQ